MCWYYSINCSAICSVQLSRSPPLQRNYNSDFSTTPSKSRFGGIDTPPVQYRGSISTPSLLAPQGNGTSPVTSSSSYNNISINGHQQYVSGIPPYNSSSFDEANNRNIFEDVDESIEDIMKMAAQRDQQRGAGRHVRGLMGPVVGKEVCKI